MHRFELMYDMKVSVAISPRSNPISSESLSAKVNFMCLANEPFMSARELGWV